MSVETSVMRRGINSLRTVGVRHTLENVLCMLEEYWFEYRYGVESLAWHEKDALDLSSADIVHAHGYKPARLTHFRHLIKRIPFPDNSTFVDFGSGKGRLLIAASQLGFQRAIGIELSSRLCATARLNIARATERRLPHHSIEVVECNALDYEIQPGENVFYFYNPFDDVIMGQVLGNIERSLEAHPRQAWLIYTNPRQAHLIEGGNVFTRQFSHQFGGSFAVVYSHAG